MKRPWLWTAVAGLLLATLLALIAVLTAPHDRIGNPDPGPNSTVVVTS